MNWRSGLFRAWIVCSVAWIGFVAITESPFSKPAPPIHITALGYEHVFPADSDTAEIKQALTTYFAERGISPQGKTPQAAAEELVGSFRRPTAWDRVRPAAVEALLPPLAILIGGLALAWIFAGFRTKSA